MILQAPKPFVFFLHKKPPPQGPSEKLACASPCASTSESPCRHDSCEIHTCSKYLQRQFQRLKYKKHYHNPYELGTKIWYVAKGHPKVGWMSLLVLQCCQPQDPLKTTLVIPNFVPYCHIFRFIYNILSISLYTMFKTQNLSEKTWKKLEDLQTSSKPHMSPTFGT